MGAHGGKRDGSGRKSKAQKLIEASFVADWFTQEFQEIKWKQLLASEDEKVVGRAMEYLTDRMFGKATQKVEASGPDGSPFKAEIIVKLVKP